jgi:uncharacterized membrane protein
MNSKLLMLATLAALAINSTVIWAESSPVGSNLGNVRGGEFAKAHDIIEKKCTSCHSTAKIDAALKSGKKMVMIQKQMEKRGAQLTASEREVLGIFWSQNPLKMQ